MGKVIFGLLIAAIVWLLFFAKRKQQLRDTQTKSDASSPLRPSDKLEKIVVCSRCGVNIPQSEALKTIDNKIVCANPEQCLPHK